MGLILKAKQHIFDGPKLASSLGFSLQDRDKDNEDLNMS